MGPPKLGNKQLHTIYSSYMYSSRGLGTTHLSARVPYQGGDEGIPSAGLPGKGRDADGDEGAFLVPACPGRRDHLGGGKPPTSKVLTMRHAGTVTVPKWEK